MPDINPAKNDTVQIRALHLPKDVHDQVKADAAKEMRTITAQATFVLTNFYRERRVKEAQSA
ncbi:MAG: hypothetical protein ACU836_14925 [Gammaproteobacteria bacterium]